MIKVLCLLSLLLEKHITSLDNESYFFKVWQLDCNFFFLWSKRGSSQLVCSSDEVIGTRPSVQHASSTFFPTSAVLFSLWAVTNRLYAVLLQCFFSLYSWGLVLAWFETRPTTQGSEQWRLHWTGWMLRLLFLHNRHFRPLDQTVLEGKIYWEYNLSSHKIYQFIRNNRQLGWMLRNSTVLKQFWIVI